MTRAEKNLLVAVLTAAAVLAIALFAINRSFYHDDAFITLRYCRNFLDGQGIVWNSGERVEGYTNFLHLILISALGRFGIDLFNAARVVSACSYAAIGIMLLAFFRKAIDAGEQRSVAVAILATMTACPLIVWTLGGLETPLFTALVTAGVLVIVRVLEAGKSGAFIGVAGALLALAAMTRIDGVVILAAAGAALILSRRGRERWRSVSILSGGFALIFLPYFTWRYSYYGDLLPNTFYVKGTGGGLDRMLTGVRYVGGYFLTPPFLGPAVVVSAFVALRRRLFDAPAFFLTLAAGLYLAYVVSVGGDHMTSYRFILPVIPVLALLLERTSRLALSRLPRSRVALLYTACFILASFQMGFHALNPRKPDTAAFVGGIVGRYMDGHWPAGSLVALSTAGSTPYLAPDLRFIDMLGLNDRHIAHRDLSGIDWTGLEWTKVPGHQKGDGAYVLSRKPDFIIVGPAEGTTIDKPWFLSDLEMGRMKLEFEAHYAVEVARIDVHSVSGADDFSATRSGILDFTYYRRLPEPSTGSGSER